MRVGFVLLMLSLSACARHQEAPRAAYAPLTGVEQTFGHLIAVGNHPTPVQYGTGERVGLFQDAEGTVWGLPMTIAEDGAILVCAPLEIRSEEITDTFPAAVTIIGSTNQPTGFREGNGVLELFLRDARGNVFSRTVHGALPKNAPQCWAPNLPGPKQQLDYYRLTTQSKL
jgi:hypothetical protein